MMNIVKRILPKHTTFSLFRFRINTGGWVSVVILSVITLLMAVNLWESIINAQQSLDVYDTEVGSLQELQQEHEQLQAKLEYYNSYEYKKLYARDNQRLAERGERLYRVLEPIEYFEVAQEDIDFFGDGDFSEWWSAII